MSLSNINIIRQNGALARPADSNDGISGLIIYASGYTYTTGQYQLFSTDDIVDVLGITGTTALDQTVSYHITEYFRNSTASLYVAVYTSTPSSYSEITDLKNFSNGAIRQIGVFDYDKRYSDLTISTIQGVAEDCESEFAPLQVLYSSKLATGSTLSNLASIHTLECNRVSFLIGEDLTAGSDAVVAKTAGASIVGTIGTALGIVSLAQVHENIGWVSKFNLVETGFQDPGFITGEKVSAISTTLLNTLDSNGYIFLRKFVGSSGTYFNYSYTADLSTSDFSTIENNRTYDKAFRLIRQALLPQVNSPLYVDSAGKLDVGTIGFFKTLTEAGLKQMKDAKEISSFIVSIDPNQDVLSTSMITIVARIVPVGVAKTIEVKLGFALSI